MGIWKSDAVICDPPFQEWEYFQTPQSVKVRQIDAINMPNLRSFLSNSDLFLDLPWQDLPKVESFNMVQGKILEAHLWQMPLLEIGTVRRCSDLQFIDAHDLAALQVLTAYSNPSLDTVNLSGCTMLKTVQLYDCNLGEAMVDQILFDLIANGVSDGSLKINRGTNAPPSTPDGDAMVAVLASRGWSVYTN